jgi:hypothetical protein
MHRYNNLNNFINYQEPTDHSNNFQNLRDDVLIFRNTQKILNKLIIVNTETFLVLFPKQ